MKNNRIVNAYNTINPTHEQKQKMLRAILQEANFEEKPARQSKQAESNIRIVKPTKRSRKSTIATIAASLAMFAVSAGILLHMLRQPEAPAYVAPPKTTLPTENIPSEPTHYGVYNAIIADYVGYLNGTLPNPTSIPQKLREFMDSRDTSGLGWIVYDVNEDGTEELLIADGELIYQAITMDEVYGECPILFTTMEEEQYYRCQDDIFCKVSDYGGDFVQYDFFKAGLEYPGYQETLEVVICDKGEYRIGETEEKAVAVDESTAQWTIGEKYLRERLYVTPFLENQDTEEPGKNLTGFAPYDEILETYYQAVEESWSYTDLENHGLATMIDEDRAYGMLGWCTLDIDTDGSDELIIGTADRIYDLYSVQVEGVKQVAVARAGNRYALCQNGYLSCTLIQGDDLPWVKTYYKIKEGRLIEEDAISYIEVDSESGSYWQYYQGASTSGKLRQPITENEAGWIMSEYIEQELFVTRFMPRDPEAYDTEGTYAETLQIYRRALTEKWDFSKCMDNGISSMVSGYGENPGNIGYTFLNLDGGEEELIITDGTVILGLYTVTDGEVTHVFTGEARISYTLVDNNWIFCRGAGGAALTYYTLYQMVHPNVAEESGMVVREAYIFDAATAPDNPWFYSEDGVNLGQPCGNFDAEARTEELMAQSQQLTFRRFN